MLFRSVGSFAWDWTLDSRGPEAVLLLGGLAAGILALAMGGHTLVTRRGAAPEAA